MDQPLDSALRRQFWTEDPRVLGIIRNVADGVIGIDAAGYIELFNPAAERLFGYAAAEVIGRNVKMLMPAQYSERHDDAVAAYLRTGTPHIIGTGREVSGQRKDGSVFPMYLSVGDISLPEYRGFIGIVHDLTAQREAQHRLSEATDLLQSILDSMASTLMRVDAQGQVTHWNRAAQSALQLDPDGDLGRPFAELFPVLAIPTDEIAGAIRNGQPFTRDRLPVPLGGEIRYLDVAVFPLRHVASGAVIRMDDVTERVRIDEMVVQTEKMMSVGGLAAGMAHEINGPLGVVAQGSQNLMRRLAEDLPENHRVADELGLDLAVLREYLERRGIFQFIAGIRDSADRAGRIIGDMLAYSRRSASSFVPVGLNSLIDAALRLAGHDYGLKQSYDFRRFRIVREGLDTDDEVACEATAIEQVLLNLLRNAAQAMFHAGSDAAPQIRLAVHDEGDWLRLEVADNGPGMGAEVARRLFEPFFTTKPVGIGTGLGLSVAYFIVTEQHRGTIAVDTAPGAGTCFTIRLPRHGKPFAAVGAAHQ